jgi:hypothetical protein
LQGGPLLQAQGLQSVVTDEQYQQLATAEVVQQAYGLHKVSRAIAATPVLKYTTFSIQLMRYQQLCFMLDE